MSSLLTVPLPAVSGGLSYVALERIIRRHLRLQPADCVELEEVGEYSNLNYVYKARLAGRCIYLKVVPERPKSLPMSLPRERVFAEAEAIRQFGRHAGGEAMIPDVLFVDEEEFVLGMTDVGAGREVLLSILKKDYSLFAAQAGALGRTLRSVHRGTRGIQEFRPLAQDRLLRAVVFQGLIAPGAKAIFPDLADNVIGEMNVRRECLVHADLWGKNILIGEGVPPAIVDFEGAFIGDPAFDVATLLAVALLPAIEDRRLNGSCIDFSSEFIGQYAGDESADDAVARAFFYTGAMIAARGFGPFAYPMHGEVRERVAQLARSLTERPPASMSEYSARIAV